MIGLDTNILVRLLVADDPEQTNRAKRLIEENCSAAQPGLVNSVVLAEHVWVLQNIYRHNRAQVASAVEYILVSRDLILDVHSEASTALQSFRSTNCDFIDALIGEINRGQGCRATASFDRKAARLDGFVAVP